MKRKILLLPLMILLSCSQPQESDKADGNENLVSTLEVTTTTSEAAEDQANGYTEYIWCKNGDQHSEQAQAARDQMWIDEINAIGMEELRSVDIKPSDWSSDFFDRMTVLFWQDKDARDDGWQAYLSSGIEDTLNAAHPDVENCGGDEWKAVYGFNSYQVEEPKVDGAFKVGYQFCSFREGKSLNDLRQVIDGEFADFVERYRAENPDSSWGANVNVPDFNLADVTVHENVPNETDYMWVNIWGNPSEYDTTYVAIEAYGKDMMDAFNAIEICNEEQVYDGHRVKTL